LAQAILAQEPFGSISFVSSNPFCQCRQ